MRLPRWTLAEGGGFDPAYHFFLDEADLDLRLALSGRTAVVPKARVHHGFHASDRRRSDRVPTTLHEIGASSMVFLRRHADEAAWPAALARRRATERLRALGHMVGGALLPGEVGPLLATLEAGIAEGASRHLQPLSPLPLPDQPFLPLPGTGPRQLRLLRVGPGKAMPWPGPPAQLWPRGSGCGDAPQPNRAAAFDPLSSRRLLGTDRRSFRRS
ncbi:glycosyltransferase family 2 protein [Gemmobacter lanyuensis]